jgi:hypothetical protein
MAKLKFDRGTTQTLGVEYQNEDETARSLSGAVIRFTMKTAEWDANASDTTAVVSKNVTDGTAGGEATITIAPTDTATLTPGKYYYDIKVKEADGSIFKIDEGTITLDGSPTNRLA